MKPLIQPMWWLNEALEVWRIVEIDLVDGDWEDFTIRWTHAQAAKKFINLPYSSWLELPAQSPKEA
ncbi:hypothetical protein [Marilutibacter maris]|nr:hypothetical protein [Lysobacter maris]